MKHFRRISVLLLALLLLASCAKPAPQETRPETAAPTTEPAPTEAPTEAPKVDRTGEYVYLLHEELTPVNYDSPALLPITEDAGQEYIDGITFLCDSPFYWLKLYGLLSDGESTTQVWTGPEGTMTLAYLRGFEILDPIDQVERTIPETVALHKPPMIMITVGINGVALLDEEGFKAEYGNLIEEIRQASPDTVILLQSILPISPKYRNWGDITNATITAANKWILETAEAYGLHYLDTFSCLIGEDGYAREELMMEDGLHANRDGLTLVLEYIRTHAYEG